MHLMAPVDGTTLLDVGGPGLTTLLLARHFKTVTVVNIESASLSPSHISVPKSFQGILGDGSSLPLADESVDFVFSDNVIEHVKDTGRFLNECNRVARRGFLLTTPNYWFPFEPHYHMPLFQYLPGGMKKRLLTFFNFGFVTDDAYIQLLTARDLAALRPGTNVDGLGFSPLSETLIAWCRK